MDQLTLDEVVGLYESVGWSAYTSEPQLLLEAVQRSTFWVTARDHGALVGLARCLSDDFSIFYLGCDEDWCRILSTALNDAGYVLSGRAWAGTF